MQVHPLPRATVQQVLLKHPAHESPNVHVQKVLRRLMTCRTSALGYHVYRCNNEDCGHVKYQYHSCRDRHCPQCGGLKKKEWIEARTAELLPVKYYHVVFTIPHDLNSLVMGNRRVLYKLLFDASSQTLLTFSADKKYLAATPGIISVLHTWGQQLSFHPHIHCIVSGGGITDSNHWKSAVKDEWKFLFPVKAMSQVFKGKFLEALKTLIHAGTVILKEGIDVRKLFNVLYKKDWIVYAKAPFGGPHAVIEYLGRYTHKVAVSNHRITRVEEKTVTLDYKNYRSNGVKKEMTLSGEEFIRRFEQHILPKGFTKIRTYGYLSNRNRQSRINDVLKHLKLPGHKKAVVIPLQVRMMEFFGIVIDECPCCRKRTLELLRIFNPWKNSDDG